MRTTTPAGGRGDPATRPPRAGRPRTAADRPVRSYRDHRRGQLQQGENRSAPPARRGRPHRNGARDRRQMRNSELSAPGAARAHPALPHGSTSRNHCGPSPRSGFRCTAPPADDAGGNPPPGTPAHHGGRDRGLGGRQVPACTMSSSRTRLSTSGCRARSPGQIRVRHCRRRCHRGGDVETPTPGPCSPPGTAAD